MKLDETNILYVDCSRQLLEESEFLRSHMEAFAVTVHRYATDFYMNSLMDYKSKNGWGSLKVTLRRLVEELVECKTYASLLVQRYREMVRVREVERQKRVETNNTFMSIAISIYTPLIFIAGIYGQNFTKPDGNPGLPELSWGFAPSDSSDPTSTPKTTGNITGYGFFWLVVSFVAIGIIIIYMYSGLLSTPYGFFLQCKKSINDEIQLRKDKDEKSKKLQFKRESARFEGLE